MKSHTDKILSLDLCNLSQDEGNLLYLFLQRDEEKLTCKIGLFQENTAYPFQIYNSETMSYDEINFTFNYSMVCMKDLDSTEYFYSMFSCKKELSSGGIASFHISLGRLEQQNDAMTFKKNNIERGLKIQYVKNDEQELAKSEKEHQVAKHISRYAAKSINVNDHLVVSELTTIYKNKEKFACIMEMNALPGIPFSRSLDENLYTYTITQRLKITIGLIEGLKMLHKMRIVHGDVKPDNIHIDHDNDNSIYYYDFNVSRFLEEPSPSDSPYSPFWASPKTITTGKKDISTDTATLGKVIENLWGVKQTLEELDSPTGTVIWKRGMQHQDYKFKKKHHINHEEREITFIPIILEQLEEAKSTGEISEDFNINSLIEAIRKLSSVNSKNLSLDSAQEMFENILHPKMQHKLM